MNVQLARSNMIAQQLKPWHVLNERILTVMGQISREHYVPIGYEKVAYTDTDIPLTEGQSLLPPKVVGRALQALALTGTEKVLEIGTGTGYITACLAKLAASVVSVEIQAPLYEQAKINLQALHCPNVTLIHANAANGWEKEAPYDAIIITAAYPLGLPEVLVKQLSLSGRLFAFSGQAPAMRAILIKRLGGNDFVTEDLFETVVPSIIHAPQPKVFQF